MKISFSCHLLATLLLIAFGILYTLRTEFMPYHSVAVGMQWAEVTPSFQLLILALMRVVGSSFLAFGLLVLILLFGPYRKGSKWAMVAIPASGLIVCSGTLYATLSIKFNTPASPPWVASIVAAMLLLSGFVLSLRQKETN
jgi:hypothetical protein